jgi:hypothetical protein
MLKLENSLCLLKLKRELKSQINNTIMT